MPAHALTAHTLTMAATHATDCAIQAVLATRPTAATPAVSLLWLWPLADLAVTSVTRAIDIEPPPRPGDAQSLLQVFRL
jgi:hypothetical protein